MIPTVVITTFCDDLDALYGSLLVFRTLRTGFPTARVVVIDNGSDPKAIPAIRNASRDAGCEFRPIDRRHYTDNLRWLLFEQEEFGPLVLLDPDIMLWKNVEHWNFDRYLMAGRLMPCWKSWHHVAPRLHPSFLWIPDTAALKSAVNEEQFTRFGLPAVGYVFKTDPPRNFFYDTLAPLYLGLYDRCHAFTDDELDHFDHLFYGTHFARCNLHGVNNPLRSSHLQAMTGDIEPLRGLWRKQRDEVFIEVAGGFQSLDTPYRERYEKRRL